MLAVERRFRFELDASTLTGFIDRIDRLPDGGLRLIDYKTSKSAMKMDEAEQDLQLALYALACREVPELAQLGEVAELVYLYPRHVAHGRADAPRADGDAGPSPTARGSGSAGSSARSSPSSSTSRPRPTARGASSRGSARATTCRTCRCDTPHRRAAAGSSTTSAGPLRIAAGAGTGKTGTLQHAIVERIEAGASPGEILCLTFTVEATKEMRRRVLDALADRKDIDPDELTVQTYHAFAASIVREHALLLGLEGDAALLDRARQWQLALEALDRCAFDEPRDRLAADLRRQGADAERGDAAPRRLARSRCAPGAPRSPPTTRSRAIAPRPCRPSRPTAR